MSGPKFRLFQYLTVMAASLKGDNYKDARIDIKEIHHLLDLTKLLLAFFNTFHQLCKRFYWPLVKKVPSSRQLILQTKQNMPHFNIFNNWFKNPLKLFCVCLHLFIFTEVWQSARKVHESHLSSLMNFYHNTHLPPDMCHGFFLF